MLIGPGITLGPGITIDATAVPVTPVTSNLVLWYDPSDPASYPGTGTTITDLSGNGLSGTMSNITWTDPYFAYNGTSSQISIADNALLEPGSGDWTMEAWFRVTATATSGVILGKFDPGGLAQDVSYSIRISTSRVLFAQYSNGNFGTFANSSNFTVNLDTWYQVVYVWTNVAADTIETYINGELIGTTTHAFASLLNTPSNLYIGSYNGGEFPQWFNGRIGITRLYNKALTSIEVSQNFNADRGTYGI